MADIPRAPRVPTVYYPGYKHDTHCLLYRHVKSVIRDGQYVTDPFHARPEPDKKKS